MKLSDPGIIIGVLLGFCVLISFEIRIVTYLKQMRDILKELLKK